MFIKNKVDLVEIESTLSLKYMEETSFYDNQKGHQ